MKNIFSLLFISILFIVQTISAQNYIISTTNSSQSYLNLFHNSELKLGNTTSSSDRSRCLLKFGDGSNVQIGEWIEDNNLAFKASSFTFTGGSIYNAPYTDITIGTPGEGNNRLRIHYNGTHGYIDFKDNLHFRSDVNWKSPLTLYGNGTVGIGFSTTYNAGDYRTQGYKLAVNGGILCEEIKVIVDVPDADFVFDNNYKLTNLKEVEAFILKNKHLPEIPSAEQFKKDGYKVGEMDEMLLRKVEELTLYIIELST